MVKARIRLEPPKHMTKKDWLALIALGVVVLIAAIWSNGGGK